MNYENEASLKIVLWREGGFNEVRSFWHWVYGGVTGGLFFWKCRRFGSTLQGATECSVQLDRILYRGTRRLGERQVPWFHQRRPAERQQRSRHGRCYGPNHPWLAWWRAPWLQ